MKESMLVGFTKHWRVCAGYTTSHTQACTHTHSHTCTGTGETLHMSQHEKTFLWFQSSDGSFSLWSVILCGASVSSHTTKTQAQSHTLTYLHSDTHCITSLAILGWLLYHKIHHIILDHTSCIISVTFRNCSSCFDLVKDQIIWSRSLYRMLNFRYFWSTWAVGYL